MPTNLFDRLRAPFRPDQIHWRVGATSGDKTKGMALAYIDARDVQDRLDEVCGPENWQCRYPHANGKTVCAIGIRWTGPTSAGDDNRSITEVIAGEWIWKEDGAGDSDVEAEKGALSDAFKRAAVRWGIGRYLYDLETPWVEIELRGKSYVIKQAEYRRLAQVAGKVAGAVSRDPEPSNAGEGPVAFLERCLRYIDKETRLPDLKAWWEREKDAIKELPPTDAHYVHSEFLKKGKKLAAASIVEAA